MWARKLSTDGPKAGLTIWAQRLGFVEYEFPFLEMSDEDLERMTP
jgi:hypothetical protein